MRPLIVIVLMCDLQVLREDFRGGRLHGTRLRHRTDGAGTSVQLKCRI